MGSTIENIQDTVIQITDNQAYNVGGNNNSGGNNNGVNNAQNGSGGGNNISNSCNFCGSARRPVAFSYMTTARVETTKVHYMNNVTNPVKPDTMAST